MLVGDRVSRNIVAGHSSSLCTDGWEPRYRIQHDQHTVYSTLHTHTSPPYLTLVTTRRACTFTHTQTCVPKFTTGPLCARPIFAPVQCNHTEKRLYMYIQISVSLVGEEKTLRLCSLSGILSFAIISAAWEVRKPSFIHVYHARNSAHPLPFIRHQSSDISKHRPRLSVP